MEVHRGSARVPGARDLFLLAEGIQISLVAFTVAALFHPVAYHLYFYYFAALALTVKAVYAAETGYAPELSTLPSLSPNRTAAQPVQDATDARKEKPMKSPSVIRMLAL